MKTYSSDVLHESAESFINYFLVDKRFRTRHIFQANNIGQGGFVFRGQSDSSWNLLPKAFRPGALEAFTPQPPGDPPESIDALHFHLGFQLHAEARAVHLFLECADELGIPTPLDYTTTNHGIELVTAALNSNEEFDYSCPYPPDSFERATALAQHYGVPTRFLDWSESPLVAIFFAAYGASSFSETEPRPGQEISVFYFHSEAARKDESSIKIIRAPRHENSNLLRQKGLFSVIKSANVSFLASGKWPKMEDYVSGKFQLHRARLDSTHANEVLRILFDMDVTRHSLMPSLENAAQSFAYAKTLFRSTN